MKLYGFKTFTHGWQYVLTVISPNGAQAALTYIEHDDETGVEAREGHLTRYYEKRDGALDRLIARYDIQMLERTEWDQLKTELGDRIL